MSFTVPVPGVEAALILKALTWKGVGAADVAGQNSTVA
ncbi:hypothetical protein J2T22_001863 [Pseudarthrobacter defluvii]|uniref:Uncharacterized protein n=1 Tax=Pseudarthrobacter defluvii TaxID=410837 RepID=A0ABT9UHE4_9MICC|nr:hypothetical protein [Pseudarthrobacter defluvii]